MGKAIGGMEFVRCTEVVRLSESPLLEVSLYHTSLVGKNIVAYGNKRNIDDFRALGSGYQRENPHAETFPSGFLIATIIQTELLNEYAVRCIGRRSRSPIYIHIR